MDPDLENVIRQALADAQAAGKDRRARCWAGRATPVGGRARSRRALGRGRAEWPAMIGSQIIEDHSDLFETGRAALRGLPPRVG